MTVAVLQKNSDSGLSRDALLGEYGDLQGEALLRPMIEDIFPGKIALVSSFGAESAVLLHMVSRIDPNLPVIFMDSGKLFGETLRYRDKLQERLGLTDLRTIEPDDGDVDKEDKSGLLWARDPDACCALRKTRPLARALAGFDAWITGRKAFQSAIRSKIPAIEVSGDKYKINPLIQFSEPDLEDWIAGNDLPRHPLVEDGYLSIGCMPCTRRVAPGESARSGRWAGFSKDECGIHIAENI